MANELQLAGADTGQTVYAVVSDATGAVWNGSSFESFNAANWATYAVTMTEQGSSGRYAGAMPAAAAGVYLLDFRYRAGGSPAVGDQPAGAGDIQWSGSAAVPLSSRAPASTALTNATWTDARAGYLDALSTGVPLPASESRVIQSDVVQAVTNNTITLRTALGADNICVGCKVRIISGTGAGQERVVTAYTDSTKVVTVQYNWTTNPDTSSRYAIVYDNAPVVSSALAIPLVLTTTNANTVATLSVGAISSSSFAANSVTASALAADAVAEIQGGLSTLDAAGVRAAVGLASANLDTQLTAIDDYIDTEVAAIKAKTDNLPADPADASDIAAAFAAVNSTLSTIASYVDTEVAAIKAKTDNLPAAPAAVGDIPTAADVADKILGRNLAGGSDGGRTVTDSLRANRNKVAFDVPEVGQFTVYAEDDSTTAWTGTYTRGANTLGPLTATDPG